MKKLVFIMVFAVIGASFFSCNKDEDGYYPYDDERERSVIADDIETNSSED